MSTATTDEATAYVRSKAAVRTKSAQFIGAHAFSLAAAYALGVSSDGKVTVQGHPGTLGHLVSLWNATPSVRVPGDDFVSWVARVGGVEVEIIEEAS